jgi:hypothetical protein
MKKMILALALVLAQTPAFAQPFNPAPDMPVRFLQCSIPNLKDAGVVVTLMAGGLVPHVAANVVEESIAGGKEILAVPMITTARNTPNDVLYVDSATQGQEFRLEYNPSILPRCYNYACGPVINSTLYANTQAGRIQAQLACEHVLYGNLTH